MSAVCREISAPLALSTMWSSVLTEPLTTDSPSPHAALMTASVRRPLAGLAVNITPEDSAWTICWTTTARLTALGAMPWRAR